MPIIAIDSLLAPVADASPCGEDMSAGTELFVLEAEARGKTEQQFGDTIIPGVAADWTAVRNQAQALLQRTRDLRVLMYLVRAATRLEGLQGYHAGLRVLRGLIETRWQHVHPMPDADDQDPFERINAIASLADRETLMADLRLARIGPERIACTVDEVEQAFLVKPEAEAQKLRHSVRERLRDSSKVAPELIGVLIGCADELAALDAALTAHAPGRSPDLKAPARVLAVLANLGRELSGQPVDTAADAATAAGGVPRAAVAAQGQASAGLNSRADAARMLGTVCDWLEKHEPSHPAPLLVRRAQRLLDKTFMEIIRDLVPESSDAVERLAGPTASSDRP